MNTLTKSDVVTIGKEIDDAIDAVLARHGMDRKAHRVGYSSTGFKYSVECSVVNLTDTGVNVSSPEAQGWLVVATALGFADRDAALAVLGATFTSGGRTFRFDGYKTRSPKRPVVATCMDDGKTYVFPETALRLLPGYDAASDYTNPLRGL